MEWGNDSFTSDLVSEQDSDLSNRVRLFYTTDKMELAFTHEVYTPVALPVPFLIEADRPYAGYAGLSAEWLESAASPVNHTVTLGMVGPGTGADEIQTDWHKFTGNPPPRGWKNQLPDEPVFNYRAGLAAVERPKDWLALVPECGISVGTLRTAVDTYAEVRVGDTGTYLFGGYGYDLVWYDVFLDGTVFHDSHSVEKRPLVQYTRFGLMKTWEVWSLGYEYENRTAEFDSQPRDHQFGILKLQRRL